jgi:2-keto-4-pentenoate hydratase/2-oxohepta-3-ene-1,7-dioic acid hydratase in catechol pathway
LKILRFNDDRIGILKDENRVVDVSELIEHREIKGAQRVIEEVIEQFGVYKEKFERIASRESGIPLGGVKLLAPIPQPKKCLAAFVNYQMPNVPNDFFYKAPELVGPEGTVELPDIPAVMVYQSEAELAFVIGRRAKNVREEEAMDHVFGYVPFFDISARGLTRFTQFAPKGQDTFGPCGPWITTRDEIPDPHNLTVRSWINGKLCQNYNTGGMTHKIPNQVAWGSRFLLFQPGDVISTGTNNEGLAPINDGDVLEVEIEKLGRARFFVKGHGPRKDAEFIPGVTQAPKPTGWMSEV